MIKLLMACLLLIPCLSQAGTHKTSALMKCQDEYRVNTDTFEGNGLKGTFHSNTTWFFSMDLVFTSTTSVPDAKFRYMEPALSGSTITAHCSIQEAPSSTSITDLYYFGQEIVISLSGSQDAILFCRGIMEVATGGEFTVEWAQNTSNSTPSVMKRGSYYRIEPVTNFCE